MAMKTVHEIRERYIVDEKGKRVSVLLDLEVYRELLAELESLRAGGVKPRGTRGRNGKRRSGLRTRQRPAKHETHAPISERDRAIQILRGAGMLAELDPELKRRAAEWRALPEERKREVIEKLRSIRLNPPLSQTIIEDRR